MTSVFVVGTGEPPAKKSAPSRAAGEETVTESASLDPPMVKQTTVSTINKKQTPVTEDVTTTGRLLQARETLSKTISLINTSRTNKVRTATTVEAMYFKDSLTPLYKSTDNKCYFWVCFQNVV